MDSSTTELSTSMKEIRQIPFILSTVNGTQLLQPDKSELQRNTQLKLLSP